jgi:ubiquinol-cytochrome c reductase cytochrome b subunit
MWTFGAILVFCLAIQVIVGIVMAMHYTPHVLQAFDSIEKNRRDVNWGEILRNVHSVGATMFFVAVYFHIFRGLYYGSYKAPRELLWIIGVLIFLAMMATAFMGYSLVYGQMSFWAITVITNLFTTVDSVVPGIGTTLHQWILGDYGVDNAALNALFSLHYLLPFVIVGLVALHIWALHVVGNNNPTGVEVKNPKTETIPFHPYYTVKDGFALSVFLIVLFFFVFFLPEYFNHPDNYVEAMPLVTPPHIIPEWYFLPFYAILRAIPSKLGGAVAMFGAIIVLFFIPWLDTSKVRSTRYRPIYKWFFWALVISGFVLGYLGRMPAEEPFVTFAMIFTAYYFIHFLFILPVLGFIEKPKPMPNSIEETLSGGDSHGGTPGMQTAPAAAEQR